MPIGLTYKRLFSRLGRFGWILLLVVLFLASTCASCVHDASGNPTTFKGTSQGFNADNQRNAAGYVFDGNGNPTTYAGVALGFDAEDRLTGIGAAWSASYRADGLRAKKVSGSTTTYFLYDGGLPVIEMDAAGNTAAVNVYGPDGLVARKVGATSTYYTFDQQGNVSQRLSSSESVLSSSIYDAYGVESSSGSPSDPFAYNARWGYYLDRETGLYSCMFRYYDAGQGRWLNRDPISYAGAFNLYGYCNSGPIGNVDPSGQVKVVIIWYPIVRPGHHAGIVLIDNAKGKTAPSYSFAGGPEHYGILPSGKVRSYSGPWRSGTQDYGEMKARGLLNEDGSVKEEAAAIILIDDNSSIEQWREFLDCVEKQLANEASAPYGLIPVGPQANSNSWTRKLLERSGLLGQYGRATRKRGGAPWSPGWGKDPWKD